MTLPIPYLSLGDSQRMDFLEVVGATALGATIPVVLSRYLDRRSQRRQSAELSKTGMGRYMEHFLSEVDRNAGEMADRLKSGLPRDFASKIQMPTMTEPTDNEPAVDESKKPVRRRTTRAKAKTSEPADAPNWSHRRSRAWRVVSTWDTVCVMVMLSCCGVSF